MARWRAGRGATGQAFDEGVVVGLVEEHQGLAAGVATASAGGFTTRCRVETQRSLVHCIIRSPMLTTKLHDTLGTSTYSPSALC